MINRFLLTASLLAAFAAGVGAQRLATGVSMRGKVMDANTIAESVEYWEVRGAAGESVVIAGRNNLPIIQWLRQAKNRSIFVTIDMAPAASLR
ncbi:MAG TPA: hypothetical protein VEK56_11145 [Vicinamibacterales bacterium]|nr:hypothetical protein [Vicinamibacterales bacterium]